LLFLSVIFHLQLMKFFPVKLVVLSQSVNLPFIVRNSH
jgi:hypothetical protein